MKQQREISHEKAMKEIRDAFHESDEWNPPTKAEWLSVLSWVAILVLLLLAVLLAVAPVVKGAEPPLHNPLLYGHRVVYRTVSGGQANTHILTYAGFCAPQRPALPYYSAEHPRLSQIAEQHAWSMARRCHQDHSGFAGGRSSQVMQIAGCREASEICAESWPNQTLWEASLDAWWCWRQSPSHWRTANGRPRLYGAGIARGRNGIWYSCIVAAWGGRRR